MLAGMAKQQIKQRDRLTAKKIITKVGHPNGIIG